MNVFDADGLLKLGLMHPDNLHPDARTIVPLDCLGGDISEPSRAESPKLDPMADEDQPGYIPTIDVILIVKRHRPLAYIRGVAVGSGYCQTVEEFDNAVAVEIACREILDANRWMLSQ